MTDNDWIKQLQSKMERHEEPVPDDLWKDIEARLPEQKRRQPMPAWRRYAAAAAVALVLVGTGYLLQHVTDAPTDVPIAETPTKGLVPDKTEPVLETFTQNDVTAPAAAEPIARSHATTAKQSTPADSHADETAAQAQEPATVEKMARQAMNDQEDALEATTQERASSQKAKSEAQEYAKARPQAMPVSHESIIKPSAKKQALSVGLYASNNFKPERLSHEGLDYASNPTYPYPKPYYESDDTVPTPSAKHSYKHHAPLSLGVNVQMPLTGRLALNSGIVYSRLKSDYHQGEQTLHYIGIPLGVTYTLWNYKRLNIYAVGGFQADFNVKATMKQSTQINAVSIGKDRVQFSAQAGPGLQLDLSPEFGIFIESTARHYFNNGSNVANYYKDKPWNINLNTGLRLIIK